MVMKFTRRSQAPKSNQRIFSHKQKEKVKPNKFIPQPNSCQNIVYVISAFCRNIIFELEIKTKKQ
jgi:hypothetical protein